MSTWLRNLVKKFTPVILNILKWLEAVTSDGPNRNQIYGLPIASIYPRTDGGLYCFNSRHTICRTKLFIIGI